MAKRLAIIGGDRHPLTTVSSIAVTETRVFVAQPREGHILIFDRAGKHLGAIGRSGEGPGEFRDLDRIGLLGDSVWAFDRALKRLTWFSPEGKLSSVRLVAAEPVRGFGPPLPHGLSRKGEMAMRFNLRLVENALPTRFPVIVIPESGPAITVDSVDIPLVALLLPRNSIIAFREHTELFRSVPYAAGSDRIFVAVDLAEGLSVREFTYDGQKRGDRRYAWPEETVPPQRIERIIERALPDFTRRAPTVTGPAAFLRRELPTPKVFPAVRTMLIADDGGLWSESIIEGGTVCVWRRLAHDGSARAVFLTPVSFRGIFISRNEIWGVESDDDGVQSVVAYGARS